MKNKKKSRQINNQEDEDGFSLNPYDIFIFFSSGRKQEFSTIRNTTISGSGFAKHIMISSEEKRYTNNITHFTGQATINGKKKLIAR